MHNSINWQKGKDMTYTKIKLKGDNSQLAKLYRGKPIQ